jgi:hypothetical protein
MSSYFENIFKQKSLNLVSGIFLAINSLKVNEIQNSHTKAKYIFRLDECEKGRQKAV